jgi:translation initiation factor 2 subunit 2
MTDVTDDDAAMAAMLDLTKKKKKKKKKEEETGEGDAAEGEGSSASAVTLSPVPVEEFDELDRRADYSYDELLSRILTILHSNNPDLIEKKRHTMKPPQLMRVGTKKTLWVNFQEICVMMKRQPEHVFQFFMAELGTEGSIDGNQRLVIRGKYVPKYIESLLRKYIGEYVTCKMCRSPNTALTRDSVSRLFFCKCIDCESSRSVAPIRSGYHAATRADRRAAKKAAN